jgi:hypothetical protein
VTVPLVIPGITARLLPVPTGVPPQLPEYQVSVPPPEVVAESVMVFPEHITDGVATGEVGATGTLLTVTVVEAQPDTQPAFS